MPCTIEKLSGVAHSPDLAVQDQVGIECGHKKNHKWLKHVAGMQPYTRNTSPNHSVASTDFVGDSEENESSKTEWSANETWDTMTHFLPSPPRTFIIRRS